MDKISEMSRQIRDLRFAFCLMIILCVFFSIMFVEIEQRVNRSETINRIILSGGHITQTHYDGICEITIIENGNWTSRCHACAEMNGMPIMESWNYTVRVSDLKILSSDYTCMGLCPECGEWMPVRIMTL